MILFLLHPDSARSHPAFGHPGFTWSSGPKSAVTSPVKPDVAASPDDVSEFWRCCLTPWKDAADVGAHPAPVRARYWRCFRPSCAQQIRRDVSRREPAPGTTTSGNGSEATLAKVAYADGQSGSARSTDRRALIPRRRRRRAKRPPPRSTPPAAPSINAMASTHAEPSDRQARHVLHRGTAGSRTLATSCPRRCHQ